MARALRFFAMLTAIAAVVLRAFPADHPQRPHILGVAHMAVYVSDLAKARAFYEDFLGYAEPYTLKNDDGSDRVAFIKINEDQYVELSAEPPKRDDEHLNHIAIQTDSAEAMRRYLASLGLKAPEKVSKGRIGNLNFNVADPDGHTVEIVEYTPQSWTREHRGQGLPQTRISTHMMHVGITVGPLEPAMKFYSGILGFKEFWRGSSSGKILSWVNMRVPEGQDYVEFMLYKDYPNSRQLGVMDHICLEVPDMQKAVAILEARSGYVAYKDYGRPIQIRTGVNGKRQANLYDPDGTRVELMEPTTVTGQPASSSSAPPPQ